MLRRWLVAASPLRAAFEALLLGVVLSGIAALFGHYVTPVIARVEPPFIIGPVSMCLFILRMRKPERFSCRQSCVDAAFALVLVLVLSVVMAAFSLPLLSPNVTVPRLGAPLYVVVFVFGLLLNCAVCIFGRIAVRFLLIWNQLRRKHLLWELTNAHVMMLALVAGLIILAIDIVILVGVHSYQLQVVLPATLFLIILSIVVMVIVVSPIALFSYFVVRRATDRLKVLTHATGTLRKGDYAVRVPVQGEDEVAQLQSDFNAMAMDLERTMHALQEERDRVSSLLQERRELIANVSHELRTPVATLRGYLETTLMHWDETAHVNLHHDLQVMEDEVLHLQGRVEDLFTLARADVGRLTLKVEPTAVGKLVQSVVDTRALLAWRSSRIEVVAEIPPELPLVLADARRLEQALQNLLHNGLRHTPPGGIVAIVMQVEQETVAIHVKDTGEGIAAKDLPHIWERFYQTESARTRMDGGTGLGLALVKEWIETMGGSVTVESVLSEGSCFTLRLPIHSTMPARKCEVQRSAELL